MGNFLRDRGRAIVRALFRGPAAGAVDLLTEATVEPPVRVWPKRLSVETQVAPIRPNRRRERPICTDTDIWWPEE